MQINEYILHTQRKSRRQTEKSVLSLWKVSLCTFTVPNLG